jgi:aspartyl-tRNA(Asn)/glutamyl-tRNA(Gln) amidotransferase subunit A
MPTIHAAANLLRQGQCTPVNLLDQCLAKIDQYEERVRAWVFVARDEARAQAEQMTGELRRGFDRGPLHGIPIAIKDIFDVFDWPTAAGSRLWAQSIARQDSTVVERLRQAGAVFVGKTVTTQYASFDPPITRNPWNLTRTPGGSSSGSAAAVACGMCLGAMGSQTGGSITRPASYCGVAGYKPPFGRVNATGVMPLAPSMDHPGPMGQCVRDLALMMQVITDAEPSLGPVPSYGTISPSATPPLLGRVRGLFHDLAEPTMRELVDRVCARWHQAGAVVEETPLPPAFTEVIPRHRVIMAVEGAQYHEPRLRRHPEDYAPRVKSLLEEGLACPAPEYARCKDHQRQLTAIMRQRSPENKILVTPATRGPAPAADTTGDPAFNSPWSYTGLPTVSFVAGWTADGLPIAIQLVGLPDREAELIAAAEWCESVLAIEPRMPPT